MLVQGVRMEVVDFGFRMVLNFLLSRGQVFIRFFNICYFSLGLGWERFEVRE